MSRLVWLASYPKSGNTWFRVFLTNILRNGSTPADINDLETTGNAAARALLDNALGVPCADLTADELAWYRPQAYRNLASTPENRTRARQESKSLAGAEGPVNCRFLKVHDAYGVSADGEPLFPAEITRGAVYLVRNPLDVCVSFANHFGIGVDEAIERMGRETWTMAGNPGRIDRQVTQRMLSWSGHVRSWLDQTAFPVHPVRYEDMLREPVATFGAALRFLGLPDDCDRIQRAIAFSSFERLREQERSRAFKEKPVLATSFFREGRAGGWQASLTTAQIDKIVADHEVVMQRLGYLPGEPRPPEV